MTTKFSQFPSGGNMRTSDITVGLRGGINYQFTNSAVTDNSGNAILTYAAGITGAVNSAQLTNAATGNGPIYGVTGTDININLNLTAKGTGDIVANNPLVLTTATAYAVLCGGTSSSTPIQSIAGLGTAGQVLTSNGAAALPTFQNVTSNVWIDQTTTPATLVANTSYIADKSTLITFNVPATVAQGVEFEIAGAGSGGWLVQMNTGQTANLGDLATSSAGSLASTNRYDCIKLLCTAANTTFVVIGSIGNITLA